MKCLFPQWLLVLYPNKGVSRPVASLSTYWKELLPFSYPPLSENSPQLQSWSPVPPFWIQINPWGPLPLRGWVHACMHACTHTHVQQKERTVTSRGSAHPECWRGCEVAVFPMSPCTNYMTALMTTTERNSINDTDFGVENTALKSLLDRFHISWSGAVAEFLYSLASNNTNNTNNNLLSHGFGED